MTTRRLIIVLLFTLITLSACTPQTVVDIHGEWAYTMLDASGNTWDEGTITFSGDAAKGTYLQINIYDVDYDGEYTVKGSDLKLTGYENWVGTITDADNISGRWRQDDGAAGTFTVVRK